nr:trimethylamine methyltransferase family protein [uncultured Dongia sp.]
MSAPAENPQPAAKPRNRSRVRPTVAAPTFLRRQIPTYALLQPDGLDRLHAQAEQILAEIGVEFRGDDDALELWRKAGAKIEGMRVKFEPGQVVEIIQKTTPRTFIQHGRDGNHAVEIGGDAVVFAPAYGSPFVYDQEKGRRYGSLEDFKNFVKMTWMSPWLHHSGGTICEPVDVPVNKRHLDMVYAHIKHSAKPFMGSVTAPDRAEDSIEMCRILFGADFVDKNCVILGNINTNSPLIFDGVMSMALRAYARANQAAVVVPFILGGAMGPVTTAGAIAQAHAEAMVGVALTQLERPGAPVIYGNFLSSMSLRSGAPTFGMPEPAMAYLAIGQLAQRLGVPLRCGGSLTASKVADSQAAQESADSLWPALLGGANFILHAAGWLEGGLVMGYEKFILDCDHLGMMHKLLAGLPMDENALAMDAFREVEPGKHFLGCAHTMANYTTAFYDADLADNDSFEQWRDAGSRPADIRADKKWRALLASHTDPAIDPGIDEALNDFMNRRKQSMADAWY